MDKEKLMSHGGVPMLTDKDGRYIDITSKLAVEARTIILDEAVTQFGTSIINQFLMVLDGLDDKEPIHLYINSEGGSVQDGLSVVDMMNFISAPVYTYAMGKSASMGAVILANGDPGHRYALKNAQILVHPMSGGCQGRTFDNRISMNYETRLEKVLIAKLGNNMGKISKASYDEIYQKLSAVSDDDGVETLAGTPPIQFSQKAQKEYNAFYQLVKFDNWVFGNRAVELGIVDHVIESKAQFRELIKKEKEEKGKK